MLNAHRARRILRPSLQYAALAAFLMAGLGGAASAADDGQPSGPPAAKPAWAEPPVHQFDPELEPIEGEPVYRETGPLRPESYLEGRSRIDERRQAESGEAIDLQESLKQALARASSADAGGTGNRNVILFVGDGMGVTTVSAARILAGQLQGMPGEENLLFFELFPRLAMAKTYNTNAQVPDSAGTMTAMMTGVKTDEGVIAVGPEVVRGDYRTVFGNVLPTLLERAEQAGRATGIVTTARLTHATPAACYAHSADRDWEADFNLPPDALAAGFPDIARQLLESPYGDGLEVALGGGRQYFQPNITEDPEDAGQFGGRQDGRDLTIEWLAKNPGAAYVWSKAAFDAIDPLSTDHLLGLFERSHMEYEYDRPADTAGEPSLTAMTAKAIDILSRQGRGYFLMVESGRIDHAHHASNAYRALTETIEFDRAVRTAVQRVDLANTLIIVTADHGHVFTFGGYATRGNDILGKVIPNDDHGDPAPDFGRDLTGLPYTTVSYANGPGFVPGPRPDLELVDTADPGYLQEATVPLASETHSGEDVPVYAVGRRADRFQGTVEQSYLYTVMEMVLKGL